MMVLLVVKYSKISKENLVSFQRYQGVNAVIGKVTRNVDSAK